MSFAVQYAAAYPRQVVEVKQLAADKAKAIRAVAAQHHDDFVAEMSRLGWEYHDLGTFEMAAKPGRLRQWVYRGPDVADNASTHPEPSA